MLWEEKLKLDEFTPANMENSGVCNARKHREIKYSDKYITVDISLKFGSLYKIIFNSSDPKEY